MLPDFDIFSEQEIIKRLNSSESEYNIDGCLANLDLLSTSQKYKQKKAAVLIPLFRSKDTVRAGWNVLFTRRNERLVEHSGQVAYPGGQIDKNDPSPEAAALREAHEEIGLKPADVRLLGKLPPIQTITNYLVTPVIVAIPWPYTFSLQEEEVCRVFSIPLSWLANIDNFSIVDINLNQQLSITKTIYYKVYDGETLWGVSAKITLCMLLALKIITNPEYIQNRGSFYK